MSFPPPPPPPRDPSPPQWGAPPPPPPPPWAGPSQWGSLPPFPPPVHHAARWPTAVGIMVASIFALGVVAAATRMFEGGGPAHPKEWDPRVVDIAAYVEKERGLSFEHPVYVDFLTAEQYTDETTDDESAVSEDDREGLDRYAAELRAMGVASGPVDLFEAYNQVADAGTLAFYDPDTERVTVRGTKMTVGLEVTLAHELTHALQDQHFDLQRLTDSGDDSASAAVRALAEGDALRVEQGYQTAELTEEEQNAYDEEYQGQIEDSQEATSDVPAFVSASFGAPYALGQPFVVMLVNQGGNDGVNDAFNDPPTNEESLFDPASYLADEGEEDLDLGFEDDDEIFDPGPFGATTWYLVLAERIDPKVAFDAALGWNGDAFVAFKRGGVFCVRTGFIGDREQDEEEMAAAIDLWVKAMPGGHAKSMDIDGHPGLESCDPGEEIDMELTGRSKDSLFLPSLWGFLIADAASQLDADQARCYAHTVLDGLTYEQITDPEGKAFAGDDFQATLIEAFNKCR